MADNKNFSYPYNFVSLGKKEDVKREKEKRENTLGKLNVLLKI